METVFQVCVGVVVWAIIGVVGVALWAAADMTISFLTEWRNNRL